jgi:hypothetical protein
MPSIFGEARMLGVADSNGLASLESTSEMEHP